MLPNRSAALWGLTCRSYLAAEARLLLLFALYAHPIALTSLGM